MSKALQTTFRLTIIFLLGVAIALGLAILIGGDVNEEFPILGIQRLYITLSFFGLLGGVLNAIVPDGQLELPTWTSDGVGFKPGILGDMLVGIAGAMITGILLLSDEEGIADLPTIQVAAAGLIGGYGGRQVLNVALQRVIKLQRERDAVVERNANLEKNLSQTQQDKQSLEGLLDRVNQQLHDGLPANDVTQLKAEIQNASPDVRMRIFEIVKEIRSMSWKSQELKPRITRSIPIFEGLVNGNEKDHYCRAQLGYAYKDAEEPDLEKAIAQLDKAIELRGSNFSGTSWKYELNRAFARIFQQMSKLAPATSNQIEAVLQDLTVVDRQYGLEKVVQEAGSNGIDPQIYAWIERNRARIEKDDRGRKYLALLEDAAPASSPAKTPPPTPKPTPRPPDSRTKSSQPQTTTRNGSRTASASHRWDNALASAPTTGASSRTAAQDGLSAGLAASQKMAQNDLPQVSAIRERFHQIGAELEIPPALLAAIASRESRCGKALRNGYGDRGNAWGIMQVDRRYHTQAGVGGDPASIDHIRQGGKILSDHRAQIARRNPSWEDGYLLKGAATAYNAGVGNVRTKERMDVGTTGNDYGSDVIARARFYTQHLKSLAECLGGNGTSKSATGSTLSISMLEDIQDALEDVDDEMAIADWDEELVAAVQASLMRLQLLQTPDDPVQLQRAWAKFKKRNYQDKPETIGPGSARLLLDAIGTPHPVSEQVPSGDATIDSKAGSRTGTRKQLPGYNRWVYENENVVAGVPLTWGECTKGMTRWPTQKWEIDNALRLARAFGEVRAKYGAPLRITSGFRPEAVNRAIGGARRSQHILFKALDVAPLDGNFSKLLQVARDTPSITAIGLGQRRGFLHFDIRDGQRLEFPY